MAKEKLKDRNGRTIGYVENFLNGTTKIYDAQSRRIGELKPQGRQLLAHDAHSQKLGYWGETRDTTFDKRGHKLGRGNILIALYFQ